MTADIQRQKEHIAFSMRLVSTGAFLSPEAAVGAAYLLTRFELYLRILSGVLKFDGTWKSESIRAQYDQQHRHLLPKRIKKFPRKISDVALTYKIAGADPSNSRMDHLRDIDNRIAIKLSGWPGVLTIGERIAHMRHPSAHGVYGDVSSEATFYGLLTVVFFHLREPE